MGYLRFAYDAMSEIDDFVDAIWKSLPRDLRTRRTFYKDPFGKWHRKQVSVPEKAADIYRHYDKLDIPSAIEGVIENEIKDRIFGYVGRKQAAATRNVYRHGYGNLPRVPTVSRLTGPFNR